MSESVDLVVIGAGPAGLTAAATAADCGLSVVVLDEQPAPGGQIYRGIEAVDGMPLGGLLGADYLAGAGLARAFRGAKADYRPGATVWRVDGGGRVAWTDGRKARLSVPGVLETDVEPIKNPVTGAPHRIQVVMPEGFEHIEGEIASSNIRSMGAIKYETHGSHSTLARVVQTPQGVAA